ncbi:polynucleotide kinase-phosphatase [Cellulosimicrobium arenosum]|uniref:Polynucleotide kinase-phosphatase n=1 Tax=Cellulosimicrobium arenosum TaxID=2708133 RepID=A0A927J0L1_9MICO|nr:polynucleotide kinase-phosphatase [Cellulosimicrobium arenosum]MBD8079694.1 polynucleotide kinase-phosphatase [Cellulosimicrobium arenosum]
MSELRVPASSLVVLVGVSGSGKSTFALERFGPYETVSSDVCRGLVSNDENDQSATKAAFEVLHTIVAQRLAANLLTVVDATNVQREARKSLVALARSHDVLPVAIVLDVPAQVAIERNVARLDRDFGAHVVKRQHAALRSSLKSLQREGFRTVHVLRGEDEVAAARIVRTPLLTDRRDETGPFDAIGDVHGCLDELVTLLDRLGYVVVRDDAGRPVDAAHPEGRRAILLGDLVDRGPDSPGVLRLAMGMVRAGHALAVPGNHEHKLVRALAGRDVTVSHGLETTLAQLADEPEEFRRDVESFCRDLVSHLVLDGGALVVAHAGLKESYQGRASGRVRSFALYGDTTGETDEFGLPVRYPWADDYRGRATVLYGHTPTPEARWVNNTMCLDTGCVFGGKLSALRYPEKELVEVPAARVHYEPARPFLPDDAGPGPGAGSPRGVGGAREPDLLDVTDVLGRRVVETATHGRVSIGEENAAGALEVMSRFAVDPRLLLHLPPTMSPVATSTLPGLLEHPDAAFAAYARDGVGHVVCEEKHMGSRAVLLVARDSGGGDGADGSGGAGRGRSVSRIVAERFGIEAPGAVHTRTGRSFLDEPTTALLLARAAAALEAAGTWDALGAGWVLLDAEILPWSLKADQLLRDQYASVGAAARAVMPAALDALAAAQARGIDVGELRRRTAERATDAELFVESYRRYRWDTGGATPDDVSGEGAIGDPLRGVQVAPFQVLASGTARPGGGQGAAVGPGSAGTTYGDRDHLWHLDVADALVAADPELFRTTRRVVVDLSDDASRAAGTAWWEELTAAGGEGMVVKPLENLVRRGGGGTTGGGLVQPGLKVRGREYLRIIYGPEYTQEHNLERLRERSLGRKRSLALREYALGLESLDRVTRGEPLWRVHEAVFAVLALESERVDPRL